MASSSSVLKGVVTAEWLSSNLSKPGIRVLDASWFLPVMGRSAIDEFRAKRIPGSRFFDIDGVANREIALPHMLPSPKAFASAADALDVTPDTTVVLYDRIGTFSAPRAWWTWKVFGHEKVAILQGGFPGWEGKGFDVDCSDVSDDEIHAAMRAAQQPSEAPRYPAGLKSDAVKNMQQVRETLERGSAQVVDARASGRFRGVEPEPRADIPPGHMPGALNVPFTSLLEGNAPTGKFKEPDELRSAFEAAGVDLGKPILCTCGSGATAAVLVHALHQIGVSGVALYDGSWMEWASTPGNEIQSEAKQS